MCRSIPVPVSLVTRFSLLFDGIFEAPGSPRTCGSRVALGLPGLGLGLDGALARVGFGLRLTPELEAGAGLGLAWLVTGWCWLIPAGAGVMLAWGWPGAGAGSGQAGIVPANYEYILNFLSRHNEKVPIHTRTRM